MIKLSLRNRVRRRMRSGSAWRHLPKKKEREELLEAENQSATPKAKAAPAKVTQAQIKAEQAKRMEAMRKAAVAKAEPVTHLSTPLEENLNRVEIEGESA